MKKKTVAADPVESTPVEVITTYKGFDANMQCRGYQYEIGKTYSHDGEVKACNSGFHACEYPLDVLRYYEPGSSKFAIVEQSGKLDRHDEDSKVASSSITVKASIDLPGIIKAAIEYTFSRVKPVDPNSPASNSGDRGAASNSGYSGAASNSGDRGAASNSGYSGAASNSGYRGAASNSGKSGIAADFNGFGKAQSCESGAIVCVNRDDNGSIVHIRASKVGDNGIKPNVFYTLDSNGEFVEV